MWCEGFHDIIALLEVDDAQRLYDVAVPIKEKVHDMEVKDHMMR